MDPTLAPAPPASLPLWHLEEAAEHMRAARAAENPDTGMGPVPTYFWSTIVRLEKQVLLSGEQDHQQRRQTVEGAVELSDMIERETVALHTMKLSGAAKVAASAASSIVGAPAARLVCSMGPLGPPHLTRNAQLCHLPCASPSVYVVRGAGAPGQVIVSFRGTRRTLGPDLLVDLGASLPNGVRRAVLRSIAKSFSKAARSPTRALDMLWPLLEAQCRLLEGGEGMRVHDGIFVASACSCLHLLDELLSQDNADGRPAHLQLYGHSLGAACASFCALWLRELLPQLHGRVASLRAACFACPRICNEAFRASVSSTAGGLDEDGTIVHYYTQGDPVVHKLPRLSGLTRHLWLTHLVAPAPSLCASGCPSPSRATLTLLRHCALLPGRLQRLAVDPADGRLSQARDHPLSDASPDVVMCPSSLWRYMQ